jgi:hypothetical protein
MTSPAGLGGGVWKGGSEYGPTGPLLPVPVRGCPGIKPVGGGLPQSLVSEPQPEESVGEGVGAFVVGVGALVVEPGGEVVAPGGEVVAPGGEGVAVGGEGEVGGTPSQLGVVEPVEAQAWGQHVNLEPSAP